MVARLILGTSETFTWTWATLIYLTKGCKVLKLNSGHPRNIEEFSPGRKVTLLSLNFCVKSWNIFQRISQHRLPPSLHLSHRRSFECVLPLVGTLYCMLWLPCALRLPIETTSRVKWTFSYHFTCRSVQFSSLITSEHFFTVFSCLCNKVRSSCFVLSRYDTHCILCDKESSTHGDRVNGTYSLIDSQYILLSILPPKTYLVQRTQKKKASQHRYLAVKGSLWLFSFITYILWTLSYSTQRLHHMKGIQSLQYTGQMVTYTGLNSRNELKKRVASRRGEVLGKKLEKKNNFYLKKVRVHSILYCQGKNFFKIKFLYL